MAFTAEEIHTNRDYFAAEKQRNDVLNAVQGEITFDFVLLDTRGREPFANGHISEAWYAPEDEMDKIAPLLPREKEIVTYCWGQIDNYQAQRFVGLIALRIAPRNTVTLTIEPSPHVCACPLPRQAVARTVQFRNRRSRTTICASIHLSCLRSVLYPYSLCRTDWKAGFNPVPSASHNSLRHFGTIAGKLQCPCVFA
jgi:rhodanese-related sulfurtransferase